MGFTIQYVIFVDIRIKMVNIKNIQDVKQLQQEEYNGTKDKKRILI